MRAQPATGSSRIPSEFTIVQSTKTDTPEKGLGFHAGHVERVKRLRLQACDQSAGALMRQAASCADDNASGPVPCLTCHNPLLVMSVTGSVRAPTIQMSS